MLAPMGTESDLAELSTLRSQIEELNRRCALVADRYRISPDSSVAAELETVERNLLAAHRALQRAVNLLT
jgi:hypothetical protein